MLRLIGKLMFLLHKYSGDGRRTMEHGCIKCLNGYLRILVHEVGVNSFELILCHAPSGFCFIWIEEKKVTSCVRDL